MVTYGELLYGAAKSARAATNRAVAAGLITDLVAPLRMPLGAAEKYGGVVGVDNLNDYYDVLESPGSGHP